ncbi:MAG: hypothetical protein CME69_09790 [Halobacteriovorax sp.]|nr:hypothetical protein [Halobacteriovorax sp.]
MDILRNQQNILYLSSSLCFGTKERMILRDAKILKDVGHNVFIFCLKNSLLDLKAKSYGFDCIYHKAGTHLKFIKWYKLSILKETIERLDINVVHCYDLNFVWPTSYFLRRNPRVALFFTASEQVLKNYREYWFKSLMSRVDLVYIPVKEMVDSVSDHLVVPERKIYFSGLGLDETSIKSKANNLDENVWNLGIFVNEDQTELDDIKTCLNSIWSINLKRSLTKSCHLHLYTSKKWSENVLRTEIEAIADEFKLRSFLHFHDDIQVSDISADVWMSYATPLPLEDYTITALLKGIPIIANRNAATEELLTSYGKAVSTYMTNDSRELRDKIESVILNFDGATSEAKSIKEPVLNEHGLNFYREKLLKNYEIQLIKRQRFFG